jgi:hypothetical protein
LRNGYQVYDNDNDGMNNRGDDRDEGPEMVTLMMTEGIEVTTTTLTLTMTMTIDNEDDCDN